MLTTKQTCFDTTVSKSTVGLVLSTYPSTLCCHLPDREHTPHRASRGSCPVHCGSQGSSGAWGGPACWCSLSSADLGSGPAWLRWAGSAHHSLGTRAAVPGSFCQLSDRERWRGGERGEGMRVNKWGVGVLECNTLNVSWMFEYLSECLSHLKVANAFSQQWHFERCEESTPTVHPWTQSHLNIWLELYLIRPTTGAIWLREKRNNASEQHYPLGTHWLESTLFPGHFNEITLNHSAIDIELTCPVGIVFALVS